jgi:hypothetical protein
MIDYKTLSNKLKVNILSYKIYLNIPLLNNYHFYLILFEHQKN